MQSIYEKATVQEIIGRIEKLTPETQSQWGKMNVSQMLAHCCEPIEVALQDKSLKAPFVMKLLAPLVKPTIVNDKPFKQGLPTAKEFVVSDTREFNKEKARLVSLINRLAAKTKNEMEGRKHPLFGTFTAAEWSNSTVKHLDHHLRQFGA